MAKAKNSPLTRLTVNLTPRADAALTLAARLTGDNRTNSVNRALQIYAYLMWLTCPPRNGSIAVEENSGEGWSQLLILPGLNPEQVKDGNELDRVLSGTE
jgi:hypothetical protein